MTKKHFIAIAKAFAYVRETHSNPEVNTATRALATELAATFATLNPNFDRARFLAACGVEG